MKRSRLLIATGYWLALLLLVLPLLEPVVTLLPPRPEQVRWRLQAFGALSQALLLPLLGGVVAIATAVLLGQRRVVRILALVAFLASLVLASATVLFALDFVEYHRSIDPALRPHYRVAGIVYFTAFTLGTAFLVWVGAVARRAAGRSRRRGRRSVHAGNSLAPVTDEEASP